MLLPQTIDLLRRQKRLESVTESGEPDPFVQDGKHYYPDSGYVYVYPRLCRGELSLVQMGFQVGDPDNLVVRSPVFQRR